MQDMKNFLTPDLPHPASPDLAAGTRPPPGGGGGFSSPTTEWEAYGRGSLPLHNPVSDSATPHYVSDPLPQSFVGSLQHWTALNLDSERLSRVL